MVNCNRGDRPARCRDYRELCVGRDITSRVHVLHRRMITIVDDQPPEVIALAPELRTEIISRELPDREVETLTIERHPTLQLDAPNLPVLRQNACDRLVENRNVQGLQLIE